MGQSFDELIFQCVDSGLLILGESGKHVVFWKWESETKLKKEEIPSNLPKFKTLIDEMFGAGGKLVQDTIAKEIALKFGFVDDALDLSHSVQAARERFTE